MKNLDSVPKKSNGTKMIRNIIIIVLILIIVLLGVFAYLYFMTDIFKTNKQLFFEQFAKILDKENGFIVAEKDLELRGSGEFFGTRQHRTSRI